MSVHFNRRMYCPAYELGTVPLILFELESKVKNDGGMVFVFVKRVYIKGVLYGSTHGDSGNEIVNGIAALIFGLSGIL